MRIVALAAFACALGLSLPCAAQSETEQAELPQTSTLLHRADSLVAAGDAAASRAA